MNSSDKSDVSDRSDPTERLIPPHGGYRKLRSFRTAEVVYDGTVIFCDRFVEKRSRTHDQMVQAARSGRQNVAEGSIASANSKTTELKLTNVARASLEELLLDYEDFLRQRGLRVWPKDSPEALAVRGQYLSNSSDSSDRSDPHSLRTARPEAAANTLICLINQATYLLKRQIDKLDREFLQHGGFHERIHQKRADCRGRATNPNPPEQAPPSPACPRCAKPMRLRTASKGPHAGQTFWGCSAYPECTGTRAVGP
jgi:restriction system protein